MAERHTERINCMSTRSSQSRRREERCCEPPSARPAIIPTSRSPTQPTQVQSLVGIVSAMSRPIAVGHTSKSDRYIVVTHLDLPRNNSHAHIHGGADCCYCALRTTLRTRTKYHLPCSHPGMPPGFARWRVRHAILSPFHLSPPCPQPPCSERRPSRARCDTSSSLHSRRTRAAP